MKYDQRGALPVTVLILLLIVVGAIGFLGYRITQSEETETSVTRTPFTFTAGGDWDSNTNTDAVLRAIPTETSDFTLALGDLGYIGPNGEEQQWCTFVRDRVGPTHPFVLLVGNHDDADGDGDIREYIECLPNQIEGVTGEYGIEFYFDFNNLARFIFVSPDIDMFGYDYSEGSEHYEWVRSTINEARDEGLPWVFLSMHKNCLTPGVKPCEVGQDIIDLALEMNVDLILQGHEHAYYRTHQLAHSSDCPELLINGFNEACVIDAVNEFSKGQGTVTVISGAAGKALRESNPEDPEFEYFSAINALNNENTYGFSQIYVSEDQVVVDFVPAVGEFEERFTITSDTE